MRFAVLTARVLEVEEHNAREGEEYTKGIN